MPADHSRVAQPIDVDTATLRKAIQDEYREVAEHPDKGFHFHTGRRLTKIAGYRDEWLEGLSELAIESFAGTGNPFAMGLPATGEKIVDVGSGGGIDSLIAARLVGPTGAVVGIDMTPAMLDKALPVPDGWADVVISNGVLNLTPDKQKAIGEWFRVLRPGGRLQIADILVTREVPAGAKTKIDLWTG